MNQEVKKQVIALLIVSLIILGVLVSFLLYNQWPILTGKKIVLATQPVDPFDPFRGQYMRIRYEISSIEGGANFEGGNVIYEKGMKSPYVHTGLPKGVTHYYKIGYVLNGSKLSSDEFSEVPQ